MKSETWQFGEFTTRLPEGIKVPEAENIFRSIGQSWNDMVRIADDRLRNLIQIDAGEIPTRWKIYWEKI